MSSSRTEAVHERRSLSRRFAAVMVAIILAAACFFLAWSAWQQSENVESKALAEARTLNLEIMAAWDYVDSVQGAINYNDDGSFDFKGVYCSVAGKSIAQRFTKASEDYAIKFVRHDPRSSGDEPDEFESRALEAFESGATEFFGIDTQNGTEVFRYLSVLTMEPGCLSCHGEPVGEPDLVGYLREGFGLGDVGGAVSIVIPLDQYRREAFERTVQTALFFLALALVVSLAAHLLLKRWVTGSLIESNRQLAHENEAKTNYLTAMSHEMRTPLASIIAFTDILETKDERKQAVDEKELAREIRGSGQLLLEMVNNSIDVARLDAGRFSIQNDEVDVADLVRECVKVVAPVAVRKDIAVGTAASSPVPIVSSDWDALRKILVNLLSNAVKYTPDHGAVTVRTGYRFADEMLAIEVEDNGRGIDAAQIDRIFEKYTQLESTAEERSAGSGLGLFLVKGLVEELGGRIDVASTPGKGTRFTVTVPARPLEREGEGDEEDSSR